MKRTAGNLITLVFVVLVGCGPAVPPSEEHAMPETDLKSPESRSNVTVRNGPVQFEMRFDPDPQEYSKRAELQVQIQIDDGWYLYSSDPQGGPFQPLAVELTLPDQVESEHEWSFPTPDVQYSGSGNSDSIYRGAVTVRRNLAGNFTVLDSRETIQCVVTYQVCNHQTCRQPETVVLTIPSVDIPSREYTAAE